MKDEHYEIIVQQISGIGSDVKNLRKSLDDHREDELVWRNSIEPILQMGRNIQGFQTIAKGAIYVILSVAAIVGAIYEGVVWIKK